MPRPGLSADSKLLAAGGGLAAAMLLVAVGVLLGERSSGSTAPAAATSVQSPVVVEAKTTAAPPILPTATVATAIEVRPSGPDHPPKVVKSEVSTSIDVQQLPSSTRSRPQGWSVAATSPKTAASAGWTVATPTGRSTPAGADTAGQEPTTGDSPATANAVAPEAPSPSASAAPPPVDPLVQAVREDIREDEARTK
jgi:hypothetical protein